jgi:beta-lactamase regulating signal transducer with metallopeptidase domain
MRVGNLQETRNTQSDRNLDAGAQFILVVAVTQRDQQVQ